MDRIDSKAESRELSVGHSVRRTEVEAINPMDDQATYQVGQEQVLSDIDSNAI